MKRSKFSDSQIMDAVKRIKAGIGVPYICREFGISESCYRYERKLDAECGSSCANDLSAKRWHSTRVNAI